MFKRIGLFLVVNILIMITISTITSFLGVNHYMEARGLNYQALMIFCLIWGFAGAFISLAISRWVAKFSLGVQVIDPQRMNQDERFLYETVSRLAHRAQLPKTPEVGIYPSEELNAFATGPTKNRALVAVSSGLLKSMNEKEIEGVLAHEVAHIANGDMVTMTLIQGVVNSFVMFIARVVAYFASQFVKEDMRPIVNFLTVIVLEILLSILGSMVVAWFSRQREYRADYGGASLSSKTSMIQALSALQRRFESRVEDESQPASLATLKISGKKPGMLALFSTHPPLTERIERLRMTQNLM
jgi:heat shock protein HtpX